MMTVQKKRKSRSITEAYARTVACEYCNKTHHVLSGGWVVNGNGIILCSEGGNDSCFYKYWKESDVVGS